MNYLDEFLLLSAKYNTNKCRALLESLPIPESAGNTGMEYTSVDMPDWAFDLGVGTSSHLIIPAHCLCEIDKPGWQRVDWFRALFDLATCQAEYQFETNYRPIHSYASRLPESFTAQWDYAYVNRIILFLQRWVARVEGKSEEELFGEKPRGKIHLTHDVDYVSKTLALRFKQSAFSLFNMIRLLIKGNVKGVFYNARKLFCFGLGAGNYWQFQNIVQMEADHGLTSTWNFYGGGGGFKRSVTELILDPSYKVTDKRLSDQVRQLKNAGHRIGLHQGFHSWQDSQRMLSEKKRVEGSLGESISSCRQHWLRFSFKNTWMAQEQAGLRLDTTLGFNERTGFRNGAALRLPAWIASEQRFSESLDILPMVLMDSHLFDYGQMDTEKRKKTIDRILDEIAFVGGEATVIWHQRVFHMDYNWGDDYRYLLEGIKSRGLH
jgi:hypothetical protein